LDISFLKKLQGPASAGTKKGEFLSEISAKLKDMDSLDKSAKDYAHQRNTLWFQIAPLYWGVAREIVREKFGTGGEAPPELAFSREEELFLNWGFLSSDLSPLPEFHAGDGERSVFIIHKMTDWIEENFSLFFCLQSLPAEQAIAESERELDLRRNALAARLKIMVPLHCAEKASEAGSGAVSRTEVEAMTEEWSNKLTDYAHVAARSPVWRGATEEQRGQIGGGARKFLELDERLSLLLGVGGSNPVPPGGSGAKLRELMDECRNLVIFRAYMSNELNKLRQKQERMAKKYENDTGGARTAFFELFSQKREYASLMAKQLRQQYSPFLDEDGARDMEGGKELREAIRSVLQADPAMLTVARVRMYGMPRVLLVPGRGVGTYDWSDNTVLVPLSPAGGMERALSFAFASFRWDTDEERLLKDTYGKLKDNKGKNIIDLANAFAKDYFLWVSRESKGYRILPRENHKWFRERLATSKSIF